MSKLTYALEFLEKNLDLSHLDRVKKKTKDFLSFKSDETVLAVFTPEVVDGLEGVPVCETHESMELMLYNELAPCCIGALIKDDKLFSVRANYGVGTLASLFGAKTVFVNQNSMPWCEHFKDKDEIKRAIGGGVPSLEAGFGKKVIETYEFYAQQLSKYPAVQEGVRLYHPDLQGPLDVAHLMRGPDIFIDMYDDPDFIHDLLSVITDTYIRLMHKIKPYLNDSEDGFCYHWNTLYPGEIVLRDDTAVNISPDMYNEFVKPYDEKIIKEFGKASIHYCGQRQRWLSDMLKTEGLVGINFGRVPNLEYDEDFLKEVLGMAADKKIGIVAYNVDKDVFLNLYKNYSRGVSFFTTVDSRAKAEELINMIS